MKNKRTTIIAFAIIAVVLIAAVMMYIFQKTNNGEAHIARIYVEGTLYKEIDLRKAENSTFSIQDDTGKPVSFEIQDRKIRFVQVTCPDHICENTGFVYSEGQTAICLPNKVVLVVEPD